MRTFFLSALLIVISVSYGFGQSCRCGVSDRYEFAADQLLLLSDWEKERAEDEHLPFGVPELQDNEILLHQDNFITCYNTTYRIPMWVAYSMNPFQFDPRVDRIDCFRRDIRLSDEEASYCGDYSEPVYDRGHMVPAADLKDDPFDVINSTVLSNIVPQHDNFNQKTWMYLEGYVRDMAEEKGSLYVITGSVFDADGNGSPDDPSVADHVESGRVAVPTHFYKIILHVKPDLTVESLTILLPHDNVKRNKKQSFAHWKKNIKSIDEIEQLTGYDFLATLPDAIENFVEAHEASDLW